MFHQADLFEHVKRSAPTIALPDLVERVSQVSKRPRYVLLILNLIAKAAGENGSLGPYVENESGRVPVRDWLCQALAPLAKRDCRRTAMIEAVRSQFPAGADASQSKDILLQQQQDEIEARILRSGRTNVSRAVSDLVRAGLLSRHYQGYREAVYTIPRDVRLALANSS